MFIIFNFSKQANCYIIYELMLD